VFDTALGYLLWKGRAHVGGVTGLLAGAPLSVATPAHRAEAWRRLAAYAADEHLSGDDKHALLRRVAEAVGVDFDEFLSRRLLHLMDPGQIRALPADLIDVELHTHRHRTPRQAEAFAEELTLNRNRLDGILGDDRQRRAFCYPSGDYAARFRPWLRDAGIESATMCVPGLSNLRSDPLLLPRFMDDMTVSPQLFQAWVGGFADWLPRKALYRLDPRRE
jgi:peptidoglycan/xylan/chitin deacetylase (PgdA/CDA1 family)